MKLFKRFFCEHDWVRLWGKFGFTGFMGLKTVHQFKCKKCGKKSWSQNEWYYVPTWFK